MPTLAVPATSGAASYTVWTCRGPDGAPVSARAWQSGGSPIATMSDTCASGGDLAVVVPNGRSGTYVDDAGARFQATGGSEIVGYRIWRWTEVGGSGTGGAGFYTDVLLDDFGFFATGADSCRHSSGCTGLGDAGDLLGTGNLVQGSGVRLRSVSVAAGCSAPVETGEMCTSTSGVNAAFHLQRAAFDIADDAPPVLVGSPTGELLGGTAVGGRQTLLVSADDDGAGVRGVKASVDGVPVAEAAAGGDCREPYTRAAPCPATATLALTLDTRTLTDGEHTLALTLLDGAGNATPLAPSTVLIDNAPPVQPPDRGNDRGGSDDGGTPPPGGDDGTTPVLPPPPPPPAPVVVVQPPAPPAVRGDYVISLTRRRAAAGSKVVLGGSVRERGGAVLGNASLVLERRLYGPFGGDWTELRTLTADAAGRFRLATPAAAQQLRLRLLPPRAANTTFVSPAIDVLTRLSLRVAPRPRALRNGQTLALSGAIQHAGASARGKEALVQAIVGDHWQTLDRVRADRGGRFSWRYRFQRTHTEALYSFRVVIADDGDDWPWASMTSKPQRVRVRP